MTDFTAGRLERLAASAYDLVANAFLDEPSAAGFQGQKLEPVCTEPFCGGLYWHEASSWAPEEAPPLPAMPKKGAGQPAPGHAGDLALPSPKKPHEVVSDYLASKPLDKLDLTGAKVFLPLDKPIATRVKLLPANKDEWQWWMAEKATKLLIGVDSTGEIDFAKGMKDRDEVMDHLNPWLKMDDDVMVSGKKIPKGSQLLTVKPHKAPLRVAPWIGTREQIRKDLFPLELTFGMPKKPFADYANQPPGVKKGEDRPVGGPPDYRELQEPRTVNVKRLDVVLAKPREDFKDFLAPLLTSKEPKMEMTEEEM